ncbi:MAG: tripartite tricarboxylate transporter TctB family protein [Alphaproteobacteria bacterium]
MAASAVGARAMSRDVIAGLMFLAVGLAGWWLNDHRLGSAARMGPGYMPMLVFGGLSLMGLAVLTIGLVRPGPPIGRPALAATFWVLFAGIVFALLIDRLGLFVATAALVLVASRGGHLGQPLRVVALALGLAAMSVVVFVWGLGVTMKVWPWTY